MSIRGGDFVGKARAGNACRNEELVIRAEFAGWTGDGLVRQAAYKGIELEKDPRRVIRERPKT
jgi:ATP-dependent DNA ligase